MDSIIRPTIAEIKSRISEIENLNLFKADIDEIKELLRLLFTGYALSTPMFDRSLILFRGIKYSDKPVNISFLSYRKVGAAQGRANKENEPLFYCATMREIPFFELDVKPGDKLVVSKWRTTKPLLVNNIGYTEQVCADLNSNRENQKWDNNEKVHEETLKEENILVQNFLAKSFSQRVPKDKTELYKLTIAIAEKHYVDDIFQGLLYPTIPMKANGDNFAIRPSFIESGGLEFLEAEWIEVTKAYDFKYDINVLDWTNSISKSDEVEWKGRLPQWTFYEGDELFFTIENGKQIARNRDGEIIEPH